MILYIFCARPKFVVAYCWSIINSMFITLIQDLHPHPKAIYSYFIASISGNCYLGIPSLIILKQYQLCSSASYIGEDKTSYIFYILYIIWSLEFAQSTLYYSFCIVKYIARNTKSKFATRRHRSASSYPSGTNQNRYIFIRI